MGDLRESWSASSSYSSSSFYSLASPNPLPLSIDMELWLMAEERTQEIVCAIQPAVISDRSRKEIIDYVQKLIKDRFGTEVFSFGSVPLKTYLPDGDIDLTVLSSLDMEEDLINGLFNILAEEENNFDFQVKDVSYISAQVKVIKCAIRNIAVDISFNQMEGLCALCFMEQVDQLIGKDHLFKRSIVLVKAWCYYESRILGAHCGLFSTYALEVLVLHIINIFHPMLCGPLAVLYKFLNYYSKFDWDKYCVSINGPASISSLPNILAGPPDNNGTELLLHQGFLQFCRDIYSVPIKAVDTTSRVFTQKHLNIVDPLKEDNNLGRSVSKGNSYRIRAALASGERKLKRILMLPGESMGAELENFFVNALDRNGKGQRHDVGVPVSAFGTGKSEKSELGGDYNDHYKSLVYGQLCHGYQLPDLPLGVPSAFQIQNTSPWDTLCHSVFPKQYDMPQGNMEVSVMPSSYPHTSQVSSAYLGFQNPVMSRGTGTYIPHSSFVLCGDTHAFLGARNPGCSSNRPLLGSLERTGKVQNAPEMTNLASSSTEPASKVHQLIFQSVQAQNRVPSLGITRPLASEVKVSGSPSRQPSIPIEPADSATSSASGSRRVEEKSFVEPYQLKD